MAATSYVIRKGLEALSSGPQEASSLFARIEQGDRAVVQECITEYGPFIWSLAKAITDSVELAELATREIFEDIWNYSDESYGKSEREVIVMIARRRMLQYVKHPAGTGIKRQITDMPSTEKRTFAA